MGGANDITTKDSQLDGWEGLVMSIVAKVTFLKGEGIVEEKVCVFFFIEFLANAFYFADSQFDTAAL